MSISPSEGTRLRVAWLHEAEWLGSDALARQGDRSTRASTSGSSARATCWRCGLGGGTTWGEPRLRAVLRRRRLSGREPLRHRAHERGGAARLPGQRVHADAATPPSTPSTAFRCSRRSAAGARCRCSCATSAAACSSTRRTPGRARFELSEVKTAAGAALGLDSAIGFVLPLRAELAVRTASRARRHARLLQVRAEF